MTINQYAKDEIRVLKELTWHYVIVHHELATRQHGQQRIVEILFTTFLDAALSKKALEAFSCASPGTTPLLSSPQPRDQRCYRRVDEAAAKKENEAYGGG